MGVSVEGGGDVSVEGGGVMSVCISWVWKVLNLGA